MTDILHSASSVEHSSKQLSQDAETITDICCREQDHDSEIHLISLLEERIPRYTLRSDTLTNFAGYENEDWTIKNPCFQGDFDPDLSVDIIEETLKYFIMGGKRISEMTKAFDDSRALTLLLEEKERDLEISSEMGKLLIKRIRNLEKNIARHSKENEKMKTQVSDLQRELTSRDSLLRVYVKDFDSDSETEDEHRCITDFTSLKLTAVNVENVRKKVKVLESENEGMTSRFLRMEEEMEEGLELEDRLVADLVERLLQMNHSVLSLREELDAKSEFIVRQQEDLSAYAEQNMAVEAKAKKMSDELRRSSRKLSEAEKQQQTANAEVEEWKQRYAECWDLLQAANEELKLLRKQRSPTSVIHRNYSSSPMVMSPFLPMESLASELSQSLRRDLFDHLGISITRSHSRKVMDVAKIISRASSRRCLVASESEIFTGPGSADDDDSTRADDQISDRDSLESQCGSLGHGGSSDISDSEPNGDEASDWSQNQRIMSDFNHLSLGQPGIPGSNDLEVALKRLHSPTVTSSPVVAPWNNSSTPADIQSKESPLPTAAQLLLTTEVRSRASSFTSQSEASSSTFTKPKIPEKLQIVKPLEGSFTLNHWKSLAVPNLQGLLEPRPGVQTKDQPPAQLFLDETEVLSLGDFEEDYIPPPKSIASDEGNDRLADQSHDQTFDLDSRFCKSFRIQNAFNHSSERVGGEERGISDDADGQVEFGTRTLPVIVTAEKIASNLTEIPRNACCIM